MNAKHTPGEWLIADKTFVYALNDAGYNRFWANVTGGNLMRAKSTSPEELEANARLIAAAPDLLEALKAMVVAAERVNDCSDEGGLLGDEFDVAVAAIAKATGEQS